MPKHCKDPTHEKKWKPHIGKNGVWACLTCNRAYQKNRRAQKLGGQIVPDGKTMHQIGAERMWARRRDAGGISQQHSDKLRQALNERYARDGAYQLKRTHCKRGHEWNTHNTRWASGRNGRKKRVCLRCKALVERGRPDWITKDKVRISIKAHDEWFTKEHERLRQEMMQAHPDKGGAHVKFINARKRLQQFFDSEVKWYVQFELLPPKVKR